MKLQWGAATDIGEQRRTHEDAVVVGKRLCAVADGVGGRPDGEVAAALAIATLSHAMKNGAASLADAVRLANDAVYTVNQESDNHMCTTLCALAPVRGRRGKLEVVNVGDSRAYRYRDGQLTQITRDHNVAEELVEAGKISRTDAETHPDRHRLSRALGSRLAVDVETFTLQARLGDRYLLCTDGLSGLVDAPTLAATLGSIDAPRACATELVRLANEAGGYDNTTVIVVDVHPDPPTGTDESRPAADH